MKGRQIAAAKWGLITPWDKDMNHFALFNCRSETMNELNSFKKLSQGPQARRGIVFFDGFYEWKGEKGKKQPHYIYRSSGKCIIVAVLFNECPALSGTRTFTIVTRSSHGPMQKIHSRQPVVLSEASAETWIHGTDEAVKRLLASEAATDVLDKEAKFYAVTKAMGVASYKGEDCSKEIVPSGGGGGSPARSQPSIKNFFSSSSSSSSSSPTAGGNSGRCVGAFKQEQQPSLASHQGQCQGATGGKSRATISGPLGKFFSSSSSSSSTDSTVAANTVGTKMKREEPDAQHQGKEAEKWEVVLLPVAKAARTAGETDEIIDLT
jgi:putative SOS response-associated peptidase YedK